MSDGPSETKEPVVHSSKGEDVFENLANKGISAKDVSLARIDRVTEKGKVDAANVGGDFENPDSASGDGNVTAEDSGKVGALASGLANVRSTWKQLPRAAAEVIHAVAAIPVSNSVKVEGV